MNINYRVVALDPGGTTGWAMYDAELMPSVEGDGHVELIDHKLTVGHLGPHEHHEELYAHLEYAHIHNFYLVTESFEFRQGKQRAGINLMSKEYIGVAKLFAQQRLDKARFTEQTAAMAKGFVTDEKLKIMGWYNPGWKHANDATRHLVYFLVNRQRRTDLIESWRKL